MLAPTTGTKPAANSRIIALYKPLAWQIAPWRDKAQILLLTGSAGGGKSRIAAEKVHAYCKKYPGATGLMLRKAREYAGKSIVPFMRRTVIGPDPAVTMHKTDSYFDYTNRSMLYWGGMKDDSQREGLRSIGQDGSLDIVWIEEANAFTRNDLDELLARMRGKAADWTQIILTTNPDVPTHWIYQDLIHGGQASVYYSGAKDNPYNPPAYLQVLGMLKGILKKRLADGLWVQAEGAVYDEFDPSVHVIDPFPIPPDWRRVRVVDMGYTNPFVCQWWAQDPKDGILYMYREIYVTQRLVEDLAKEIVRLSAGEIIETTVADWDAEDRATLERHGVPTIPARKEISPGIQAVKARLAVVDGKPRLRLMRGALVEEDERLVAARKPTCTEAEFPGYVWPKTADGRPVKETPVKEDDHGMDDVRYLVQYFDGGQTATAVDDPFAGW